MKKNVLLGGILVLGILGISFTGCNKGLPTEGDVLSASIVIIGIDPQYNGRYAVFQSSSSAGPEEGEYSGYMVTNTGNNGTVLNGVVIADGSVTLPVYLVPCDSDQLKSYGGSGGSNLKFYVNIQSQLPK
jgi:hypothetical protein